VAWFQRASTSKRLKLLHDLEPLSPETNQFYEWAAQSEDHAVRDEANRLCVPLYIARLLCGFEMPWEEECFHALVGGVSERMDQLAAFLSEQAASVPTMMLEVLAELPDPRRTIKRSKSQVWDALKDSYVYEPTMSAAIDASTVRRLSRAELQRRKRA
jgi:hypothetical protein